MDRRSWLLGIALRRIAERRVSATNPFLGEMLLVTTKSSYRFVDGVCIATLDTDRPSPLLGLQLIGFLVEDDVLDDWPRRGRAVLFAEDESGGTIALTSKVSSWREAAPEKKATAPIPDIKQDAAQGLIRTNAAIPIAKLMRNIAQQRVSPPSFAPPDPGSSTRVDLSLLDEFLGRTGT